jgi:hypothetical protein
MAAPFNCVWLVDRLRGATLAACAPALAALPTGCFQLHTVGLGAASGDFAVLRAMADVIPPGVRQRRSHSHPLLRTLSFTPSPSHPLRYSLSFAPSSTHPLVRTHSFTPPPSRPLLHTHPAHSHPIHHTLPFTTLSFTPRVHRWSSPTVHTHVSTLSFPPACSQLGQFHRSELHLQTLRRTLTAFSTSVSRTRLTSTVGGGGGERKLRPVQARPASPLPDVT